jgi:hypothetical protein
MGRAAELENLEREGLLLRPSRHFVEPFYKAPLGEDSSQRHDSLGPTFKEFLICRISGEFSSQVGGCEIANAPDGVIQLPVTGFRRRRAALLFHSFLSFYFGTGEDFLWLSFIRHAALQFS